MSMQSQVEQHFKRGLPLTNLTAHHLYKTMRLSSIVLRARKKGMTIKTEIKEDAVGEKYAEYVPVNVQLPLFG